MTKYGLNEQHKAAIRARNVLQLIEAGLPVEKTTADDASAKTGSPALVGKE